MEDDPDYSSSDYCILVAVDSTKSTTHEHKRALSQPALRSNFRSALIDRNSRA